MSGQAEPGDDLVMLLREASTTRTVLSFPSAEEQCTAAELWDRAGAVAQILDGGPDLPVAMRLQPCIESVAGLFGSWRAGRTAVSLPPKPTTTPADRYREQLEHAIRDSRSVRLVAGPEDDDLRGIAGALGVEVVDWPSAQTAGSITADVSPSIALVQFSSGSTGVPKGICLPSAAIVSNMNAIACATGPPTRVNVYSWLPLSHDMGLVGMLLTAYLAAGPRFRNRGTITIDSPSSFARHPGRWMQECATRRATITAGPALAFRHAFRHLVKEPVDLGSLECCIVGAEPIPASVLREIHEIGGPLGLGPTVFRPAYGLAESCLAVTLSRVDQRWRALSVDSSALEHKVVQPAPDGTELVACGRPVDQVSVRVETVPGEDVGVVHVAGSSLFSHYLADRPGAPHRWHQTSDLGFVYEGELYIVGRADDLITLAGRNIQPAEIEAVAGCVQGVRQDMIAAVRDSGEKYALVAVLERRTVDDEHARRIAVALRRELATALSATPSTVVFVPLRSFLRTSSGKIQRRAMGARLAAGTLECRHTFSFAPR